MKKYCAISYIFNGAEPVREPLVVDSNCDYYLFTDDRQLTSKTWKIVYMERIAKTDFPGYKKAYLIKNGFHYYIPNIQDYEYFVVVDSSILIKDSLNPIIDFMENRKYDVSVAPHPWRDNFMDEYDAWVYWRHLDPKWKDNFIKMTENTRMPGNGLIETTFKVLKNNKEVLELLDDVHNTLFYSCNFDDNVEQIWFSHVLSRHLGKLRINYLNQQIYINSDYMLKFAHGSTVDSNEKQFSPRGGIYIQVFRAFCQDNRQ